MKSTACKTLITVSLVLIGLVPAYAQQTSMTVTIPVAFTVEQTVLPAGNYVVTHPQPKGYCAEARRRTGNPDCLDQLHRRVAHAADPASDLPPLRKPVFPGSGMMPNSDQGYEFFASAREIQLARIGVQDVVELAVLAKK